MTVRRIATLVLLLIVIGVVVRYKGLLPGGRPVGSSDEHDHADHHHAANAAAPEQVKLSRQARENLRLVSKPLKPQTFWRTLPISGTIVDRPGFSDRGVIAPVSGVVARIHAFPGDTVKAGETLFTLRLISETLHATQSELFKAIGEIEISKEHKKRISDAASGGGIAGQRLIEVDNQIRRMTVAAQAYRQELQTRGLTAEQIQDVELGKYVTELQIAASETGVEPRFTATVKQVSQTVPIESESPPLLEVQDLRVELGQQVQAGQMLCLLSNHQLLYIEGHGFRQEAALIEAAIKNDWSVEVEFKDDTADNWPPTEQTFSIRHITNNIDPDSRTFAFYLPLKNQVRSYEKEGRTLLLPRYRPGQKVRLKVRTERFDNVFVLPAEAVVREGPEAYVFRQNGELFERKSVRVLFEERENTVLAVDGSIAPGVYVARNGAAQINRVLKSQSNTTQPGVHVHADGTVHASH